MLRAAAPVGLAGSVGTGPKAVLERTGAGHGSMYRHVRGKPDLALAAVRRRTAEEMAATAEGVLGGGPGTPYERIAVDWREPWPDRMGP